MRNHIIRTGTLIVVLVVALLFASARTAQASTYGAAAAKSSTDCQQPPNDVDHATFTAAQLALYGLPQRLPGEDLKHWQTLVRAAKHRVCTGTPTDHFSHLYPGAKRTNGTETSQNWVGYVATGWGYTAIVGNWTVPCLSLQLKTGDSSTWVGLGGDGDDGGGNLAQTGTEQDESQDWLGRWVANYYAWYEDYPSQSSQQAFGVNCGDSMEGEVSQFSPPVEMYLVDENNNTYLDHTNSNLVNGSTAEWITERPGVNGKLTPLADFQGVSFVDSTAYLGSLPYSLNALPYNEVPQMWNNNYSQNLAWNGGLDSNNLFWCWWNATGP